VDSWQVAHDNIVSSNVEKAITKLSEYISNAGISEFLPVLSLEFSIKNTDLNTLVVNFLTECKKKFEVKSIYLEMNGFDINYDRWYFDYFAYNTVSHDLEDIEWLCEWQSDNWPETELSNSENSRSVFEWYHENNIYETDENHREVYDACMLLVHCKFIQYVNSSLKSSKELAGVTIFSAAHGFESAGKYEP